MKPGSSTTAQVQFSVPSRVEVDSEKATKEIRRIFKHNCKPLLNTEPTPTASVNQLAGFFDNLFGQVAIEFRDELAGNPDLKKNIQANGRINKYVKGPNGKRNVFIAMNNFFGAVKAFPDAEERTLLLGSFLNLDSSELACAEGTIERLQDILAPMLPGNPLLTSTYTDRRTNWLYKKYVTPGQALVVHVKASFDHGAGVMDMPPAMVVPELVRDGKEWAKTDLKYEIEDAIQTYLETGFQKVLGGLDQLFKSGNPSKDEIRKFHQGHLSEFSNFLDPSVKLDESMDHVVRDEKTYEYTSFNRANIIADVAAKIFPVLTLESKLKLFNANPELFAIPKVLSALMIAHSARIDEIVSAMEEAFPGQDGKVEALMSKPDDATGNTPLHDLLLNGYSICGLLAEGWAAKDVLSVANAAGQTPVDILIAKKMLPDLMVVMLHRSRDEKLDKKLEPILGKYLNAETGAATDAIVGKAWQNRDLLDTLNKKGIMDAAKCEGLLRLAFHEGFGREFVLTHLDQLSRLDHKCIAPMWALVPRPDPARPAVAEAGMRVQDFLTKQLEQNSDRLAKLKPDHIKEVIRGLLYSAQSAKFIEKRIDACLGLSAEGMSACVDLLKSTVKIPYFEGTVSYSGGDILKKHFTEFQRLSDRQKEETAEMFAGDPLFMRRHASSWFQLNAGQMLWTKNGIAENVPFVKKNFSKWVKLHEVQMMQLLGSHRSEPGTMIAPLVEARFAAVRKFNVMQLRHTRELLNCNGGRAFLNRHFEMWKSLGYTDMKALLDVYKASTDGYTSKDVAVWTGMSRDLQQFLAREARKGMKWSELRLLLAPGMADISSAVREFIFDPIYREVFRKDPRTALPDRMNALITACKANAAFREAVSKHPEIVTDLPALKITETAYMFNLDRDAAAAAAQFVMNPVWKTLADTGMSRVRLSLAGVVIHGQPFAEAIVKDPELIRGYDGEKMYVTNTLFDLGPSGAAYIATADWKALDKKFIYNVLNACVDCPAFLDELARKPDLISGFTGEQIKVTKDMCKEGPAGIEYIKAHAWSRMNIAEMKGSLENLQLVCTNKKFKEELDIHPDLIRGLKAAEILETQRMFSRGAAGLACIKDDRWKTCNAGEMQFIRATLVSVCAVSEFRDLLDKQPDLISGLSAMQIRQTAYLFGNGREAESQFIMTPQWSKLTAEAMHALRTMWVDSPAFKEAVIKRPDLIDGLDQDQITITADMFNEGPAGAAYIGSPRWKKMTGDEMSELHKALRSVCAKNPGFASALAKSPYMISDYNVQQIKATEQMFASGDAGANLVADDDWKMLSHEQMKVVLDASNKNMAFLAALIELPGMMEELPFEKMKATEKMFSQGPAGAECIKNPRWRRLKADEMNAFHVSLVNACNKVPAFRAIVTEQPSLARGFTNPAQITEVEQMCAVGQIDLAKAKMAKMAFSAALGDLPGMKAAKLTPEQMKATEKMFSQGPAGAECIKYPLWRTLEAKKMNALHDSLVNACNEVPAFKTAVTEQPSLVRGFTNPAQITETACMCLLGEIGLATVKSNEWRRMTAETMALARKELEVGL